MLQKKKEGNVKTVNSSSSENQKKVNAIVIKYSGPMETYNIQELYRFEPPVDYMVWEYLCRN